MKSESKGVFRIESWEEEVFSEAPGGPTLKKAHVKKTYEGEINGVGIVQYIFMYTEEKSASIYGLERFSGKIIMGEDEKIPVAGRVIWLTPKGAQGKRTAGIGVQFSDQDGGTTQKKIENYLAGALGGDKLTHTM